MGDDSDSDDSCTTPGTSQPGHDLVRYIETAVETCATANVEAVKIILGRLSEAADDAVMKLIGELCGLFERYNTRQVSMIKQALGAFLAGGTLDMQGIDKVCGDEEFQEGIQRVLSFLPGKPGAEKSDEGAKTDNQAAGILDRTSFSVLSPSAPSSSAEEALKKPLHDSSVSDTDRAAEAVSSTVPPMTSRSENEKAPSNWSESWKRAVRGVLKKHRRERIRDKALRRMKAGPRKIIPKSDATKERLRKILGEHFLFGDLDASLREEIIDAFQDVRVAPGTEIIKQGDIADNFYIIDVGEFDILAKKGNEPPTLVKTRGAGESFGELALMYDNVRNATCKATVHSLLWAVDRATFKSIIGRHLAGSATAQVLREAPILKKLSTKEIVSISQQCTVSTFQRGQHILLAGVTMDKVHLIQDGQVRVSWGAMAGGSTGSAGGETVAVMNRLEVLGEALLLSAEAVNLWTYVASSEHVTTLSMDRSVLTEGMLHNMRKGLQIQLVTLALQRVPAFLELSFEKHARLAEAFGETCHLRGQEIITCGAALGSAARIYVVQNGSISLSRVPEPTLKDAVRQPRESSVSVLGGWSTRFGSLLKTTGSGSTPQTPRGSIIAAGPDSLSKVGKAVDFRTTLPELKLDLVGEKSPLVPRQGGSPRQHIGSTGPWTITTYGVFGDECLLNSTKDDTDGPLSQAGAVVESAGAVCLSVSLAEVTAIIGPVQELLTRNVNLKVLRKVPCLEYLTASELDSLSRSMGILKLKPGETVYRASDVADRLYIVRKGTVHEAKTETSTRGSIRSIPDQVVYSKGSFFGDEALLQAGPRSCTMVAGEAAHGGLGVELVYLDRAVLETNLGPLVELNELRRKANELKGIVKTIVFEELQIIGLLGTGLFGKVKLVYSNRSKMHYALKCVNKAKVVKMQEEEHLRNEKLHMGELDHPFITKLIRTFKDQTCVYLLQELTTGRELFLFMEKIGRLQEWEAAFYAGGVLLALEYMHSKGIVYRDLKPENTLIGDNGYPKLIDMGFAKKIHNRRTYSMCGTPDYMAPEIIKRQGHGKAVDYWALGCMIFEMITNTSPFNRGDDSPQVVFQKITEGRIRFPPYMSFNAVDIIKKLLDSNPETRLGCRKRGALDVKEHPFFTNLINFQLLIRQKEDPPMIPPRIMDYSSLCIRDDEPEYVDVSNSPTIDRNWDDIF